MSRVSYFYRDEVADYSYGEGHPMKVGNSGSSTTTRRDAARANCSPCSQHALITLLGPTHLWNDFLLSLFLFLCLFLVSRIACVWRTS